MRGSDNCLFCFVLFCFFFLDAVVTVDVLTAKKKKKKNLSKLQLYILQE